MICARRREPPPGEGESDGPYPTADAREAPGRTGLTTRSCPQPPEASRLVTDVATRDVPRHVVDHLSHLPAAHRRRIGTPRGQPGTRPVPPGRPGPALVPRTRLRALHCLARDADISQATGYRYLHEGIDILADQARDLHEVLDRCRREATTHVILDGTLIESDRLACVRDNGNDLWPTLRPGLDEQPALRVRMRGPAARGPGCRRGADRRMSVAVRADRADLPDRDQHQAPRPQRS